MRWRQNARTAAARSSATASRVMGFSIVARAAPRCRASRDSRTASSATARAFGVKWKNRGDPHGRIGDERVRTKFAWLPVEADDGFTYWLAPGVVTKKLLPKVTRAGFEDDEQAWHVVEAKPVKNGGKKSRKK